MANTRRLGLVAAALLVLLAIVAFASRSGFGHTTKTSPSPTFVSYAFSAFLIVFVLAIPVVAYAYVLQAREGDQPRRTFRSKVIQNVATVLFFTLIALVIVWIRKHHWHFIHVNPKGLTSASKALHKTQAHGAASNYQPTFEWPVLWAFIALLVVAVVVFVAERRRARARRTALPQEESVSDDFVETISAAIDDLEAEPDPRRAVIAAYARMEGVLGRHGLRRAPSETPLEYLRRVLLEVTSRGEAVARLTSLFEQAKFSRHRIDNGMKGDAIGALREIRDDLQGAAV